MRRDVARPIAGVLVALAAGCAEPEDVAVRLAERLLIVDTHIDVPYRLEEHPEDVGQATARGDFDYPRARKGGLDVAFFSIYVPSELQGTGGEAAHADRLIDGVQDLVARHPDKFALTTGVEDLRRKVARGLLVLPLGMENGAPIGDDLGEIERYHERGIRYITLTHGKVNQISDSSYDESRPWGGLSPFGERVVAEMNRVGIMVDVSHVSDAAFERVLRISRAPVIASHSSCRAFTPGWERNMSDEMIRALGARGGVIQINFGSGFLDDRYRRAWEERRERIDAELASRGLAPGSAEGRAFADAYRREHRIEPTNVSAVADHIEHAVRLAGIDHVGLGSDFDGVGDSLPVGLEDVSGYPNLLAELLRRGMSEADLAKICGDNLLRVWSEVERVAAELQVQAAS
jgi:membrane dipeptidase